MQFDELRNFVNAFVGQTAARRLDSYKKELGSFLTDAHMPIDCIARAHARRAHRQQGDEVDFGGFHIPRHDTKALKQAVESLVLEHLNIALGIHHHTHTTVARRTLLARNSIIKTLVKML